MQAYYDVLVEMRNEKNRKSEKEHLLDLITQTQYLSFPARARTFARDTIEIQCPVMALYLSAATIACAFLFGSDESKVSSTTAASSKESALSKSLTVMGGTSFLYGVGKYRTLCFFFTAF